MAGITIKKNSDRVCSENIIRAIPNTPLGVGKGVVGYCVSKKGNNVSMENFDPLQLFIKIFCEKSLLIQCKTEEKIDKITALSGSGPAYYYFITEIIQQKALEFGFSQEESKQIANTTFIGAAELLQQSNTEIEVLRKNITSPGGTTQKAIETFKKNNLQGKIYEGIDTAYFRAKEL